MLEKQLGLWDVYAVATGATLSSGFFLLPGLAAARAGTAMPLSYVLAAAVLLPGLMSMVELSTAMPKAGGIYYFLDRSMGPLAGTIGGFGTWIALVLKSAFALIGVGAYLQLFLPGLEMGPIAALFAVVLGVVNYFGTKKSGSVQVLLLVGLMFLLGWFCGLGLLRTDIGNFRGLAEAGGAGIVGTAGLVIVSYMGLTKVVGVAEEVRNPHRNLPLGMFLAFGTVVGVFVLGTTVMLGVVGGEALARGGGDLTPAATVAEQLVGPWGVVLMTVAAVLAFTSAANAGILSASRYPLAMSRDALLPDVFRRISVRGTPTVGIAVSVALILLTVTLFDPTKIAKLASAFMLVMFAFACLAVWVMRESLIESYDPGYLSPLYPALHVLGILGPLWLIVKMGLLPTLFTGGLITLGAIWYTRYARDRVDRGGAILHVFERLGRRPADGLAPELRELVSEASRGNGDPFDGLLARSRVLDLAGPVDFQALATQASERMALDLPVPARGLAQAFLRGTLRGATPVAHGVALPHVRLASLDRPCLLIARVREGVRFGDGHEWAHHPDGDPVRAVLFLAGKEDDPASHLGILAQIAQRVDREGFMSTWLGAQGPEELKGALARREEMLAITLVGKGPQSRLVGHTLSEISLPEGTLVAVIRRGAEVIVPTGRTLLREGDRLSVIGKPEGIRALRRRLAEGGARADAVRASTVPD